jgi:hypothetical protein
MYLVLVVGVDMPGEREGHLVGGAAELARRLLQAGMQLQLVRAECRRICKGAAFDEEIRKKRKDALASGFVSVCRGLPTYLR